MKLRGSLLSTGVVALLLAHTTVAHAQRIWVYGNGSDSCGQWIANRRANDMKATIELSWTLGWLTGATGTYEFLDIGSRFRHVDHDAVAGWLDNYCRAHPLHTLFDAAQMLSRKLKEK